MEAFATIEIQDPRKSGDYLVINARDFDPSRHRLRSEPLPAVEYEEAAPAASEVAPDKPRRGRPPKPKEE